MTTQSPFKFLDSYTKEDRDIFFGRDEEIEEIYKKVFQGQTLFIYGESGTGKSSLISCGLANRFKKSNWLPVNVRRGSNINESLLSELSKISLTQVSDLNGSFANNLFKYTRSLYLDFFKPVYFIFDQFEELYLMGSREEWTEFIAGIRKLCENDLNVHFIFIIRAEYLHFLSEFEEELPEVFNNKIRVEKITRTKARECIEGPCKIFNIKVEEGFADRLLDQLSPNSIEVELTYLQVYLDRVFKLADSSKRNDRLEFSNDLLDDIGLVSDVLADFLDEQIESMPDQESALTTLKAFVTVDGTKRQASVTDVVSFSRSLGKPLDGKKVEEIIDDFLERRIIKELADQVNFELRHDALANKIFEKITIRERELIEVRQFLEYGLSEYRKRQFLLNERDLAYVEPHLPVLDLRGELKEFVHESINAAGKKRRTRNRIIGVIVIIVLLSISSIYGFFAAQKQRAVALEQKEIAEANAVAAQTQKTIAEENEIKAVESRQLAEQNANEAARQAAIARQQRLIADLQRMSADSSRIEAEQQRLLALMQKDSAEIQRQRAEQFAKEATLLRDEAINSQMQSLARTMAIKSTQLPDPTQKALLAFQAYTFNQDFKGYPFQSEIYTALYESISSDRGDQFNVLSGHTASVKKMLNHGTDILTTGSDGMVLRWDMNADPVSSTVIARTNQINNSMAISPNGKWLAIGASNNYIQIYDLTTYEMIRKVEAHSSEIWHLQFLNNSNLLSSGSDLTIRLISIEEGSVKTIISTPSISKAFVPIRNELIVGTDEGKAIVYDLNSNQRLSVLVEKKNDPVSVLALSSDMNMVAAGFESGTIQLIILDKDSTRFQTLPGHTAKVADIKFSTDGAYLISGGYDRRSFLWNLNDLNRQPIKWDDSESFVLSVCMTTDNDRILTGQLNKTIKWYERDMDLYAKQICGFVDRNLTSMEWASFVGNQYTYVETCRITK